MINFKREEVVMQRIIVILTAFMLIGYSFVYAQDFSGTYEIPTENGKVRIMLKKDNNNGYSGKITGNNNQFLLKGTVQAGILKGIVGEEESRISFEAVAKGNNLSFTMIENDFTGMPIPSTAQTLILQRIEIGNQQQNAEKASDQVIINNLPLTQEQIDEFEQIYGLKPRPGNYWYDSKSGLYGVVGYPSYGFMLPGHNFGELSPDASHGCTGVIVNGRILPQSEWMVWSYILGYWIQPNSYWLDHMGNAGIVGVEIPLVNLFVAAQQNQYTGKGGSGDNFWSTRFSAGNYDSDNQRGYVSVPGYGPVGYGF